MQCQADIQALADVKLKEAECLFNNGFYNGAYYLGGYAVELLLKAKVCKTLKIDDFFASKGSKPGKPEMYKQFRVHDYTQLLILSGIYPDFEAELANVAFKKHWSLVSAWNEGTRYLTEKTSTDAQDFLTSLNEIVTWIKKHL